MKRLPLKTDRLELIAATPDLLRAELESRHALSSLLKAVVPAAWPPELLDEGPIRSTIEQMSRGEEQHGWWYWYIVLCSETCCSGLDRRVLIGVVGCQGPPAADGTVEIGYGVLDEFQRRGYATEALEALKTISPSL